MKRVFGMSVKKGRDVVGLVFDFVLAAAAAVLVEPMLILYYFVKLHANQGFLSEGMWQY